jgi:hypothetical protein
VPPQSSFRGHTYSEWSAAWFQWVYSLPSTHHPLFENADCSTGQTGNVWFIDGKFGGYAPFPPGGRYCTIPSGTALFLSLVSSSSDNEACDSTGQVIQKTTYDESTLRSYAGEGVNGLLHRPRIIIIGGVNIKGFPINCDPDNPDTCQSPYRVQSPVFDYTVPAEDNLLILMNGDCYNNFTKPYTVTGAVGDGVYVMINPLPVGEHTIQFGLLDDPTTGMPTRFYHITVTGHGAGRQGFQ